VYCSGFPFFFSFSVFQITEVENIYIDKYIYIYIYVYISVPSFHRKLHNDCKEGFAHSCSYPMNMMCCAWYCCWFCDKVRPCENVTKAVGGRHRMHITSALSHQKTLFIANPHISLSGLFGLSYIIPVQLCQGCLTVHSHFVYSFIPSDA